MATMRRLRTTTEDVPASAMSPAMSSAMSPHPDALDTGYVQALSSAALAQRLKAHRWSVARGMARRWPRRATVSPRLSQSFGARLGLLALLLAWACIWLGGDLAALIGLGVLPPGGVPVLAAIPVAQAPVTSTVFLILATMLLVWHALGALMMAFLVMQCHAVGSSVNALARRGTCRR